MRGRYADFHVPESPPDPDPTQTLIDKPEPAPWTHLEPLFPMAGLPFTPHSKCPHHCKLCGGAGSFRVFGTDDVIECPDCLGPDGKGTGHGPIPAGSAFVCMVCHQAGKDGHKALPRDVEEPPDPVEPAEAVAAA